MCNGKTYQKKNYLFIYKRNSNLSARWKTVFNPGFLLKFSLSKDKSSSLITDSKGKQTLKYN